MADIEDVGNYIDSCPDSQRSIPSRSLPQWLLQSIPIPERPWTHISMDFIVALPPSKGFSVIWVVVDRFSKMSHFIPLPTLHSAKSLAELLLSNRGPLNIVSDRGVQFLSRFWRSFCSLICHSSWFTIPRLKEQISPCSSILDVTSPIISYCGQIFCHGLSLLTCVHWAVSIFYCFWASP